MASNIYQIEVMESVTTKVLYIVEAGTPEEAREKAERGETIEEEAMGSGEVTGRAPVTDPLFLSKQEE
jgi:hypothetical protein